MPKISKITYVGLDQQEREVELSKNNVESDVVHFTFLTGQNGSHKSTILRQLVASLVIASENDKIVLAPSRPHLASVRVICFSGSVADRFPLKEQGPLHTAFDIPEYIYVGQMVGSNLLSKKQPMETVVQFALDRTVWERSKWPFFQQAFLFAGVEPWLEFTVKSRRQRDSFWGDGNLRDHIASFANPSEDKRRRASVSPATAKFLINSFEENVFSELENFLVQKAGRLTALLTSEGIAQAFGTSIEAVRLGLLSGLLIMTDCKVTSKATKKTFSAFELSSGEYHILTALLALGFSLTSDAVILVDEPENSLHPQWQQDFMAALIELGEQTKRGHIIVATHSPLIVSAAPQGSTIVDLSSREHQAQADEVSFGTSADEVLFERFGLASSRNRKVVAKVQEAVEFVEQGLDRSPEFFSLLPELNTIRNLLPNDDPLIEILDALLSQDTRP